MSINVEHKIICLVIESMFAKFFTEKRNPRYIFSGVVSKI